MPARTRTACRVLAHGHARSGARSWPSRGASRSSLHDNRPAASDASRPR
jgi:hypothetical protein